MEESRIYVSYGSNSVVYDLKSHTFCINAGSQAAVIRNAEWIIMPPDGKKPVRADAFKKCTYKHTFHTENNVLSIQYAGCGTFKAEPSIEFRLDRKGVRLAVFGLREHTSCITGSAYWGENNRDDTFAMCIGRSGADLRCALGPAASAIDNALYDRRSDRAFVIDGGETIRFKFDWEKGCYNFRLTTGLVEFQQRFLFYVKEHILAAQYGIEFAPINKKTAFQKPPAGWMTWYAVKFDASEKTVLENVKFQEEHLKRYGADAIWVDWEWYHQDLSGERSDGTDTFHPDVKKYPHGLQYISDSIKKAGFIPALWIGFTNDSAHNAYTREHPEMILKEQTTWCGTYFYDFSHPEYLNGFLPLALKQVLDWGYQAVKFDTLPAAIEYHETYHMRMYDPSLTTKEAFRAAMRKTREILGKDVYMLSCAAVKDADLLWAADIFDAGRVGNDIFEWSDFIKEGVRRTMKFYALHNIVLYPDPDNVVLREEFNTENQAASRIYFVALLGLPMTFGDAFNALQQSRVALIKNCLPVMDIHPMDLDEPVCDPAFLIINLSIELPFESYTVADVFHLMDTRAKRRVYIEKDLHLEHAEYHVFDFTKGKYLGAVSDFFEVEAEPCESRIFSIRKKTGRPQILSTSRHVTQGAAEIKTLAQDDGLLAFSAELVGGDEYAVYLYIPDGCRLESSGVFQAEAVAEHVYRLAFTAEESKVYDFHIKFA